MTKPSQPISKEKVVAASEARFRALVTATSDSIYSMSADWGVMRELDGRGVLPDTREPITDWLSKYIHPQDQEKVKTAIHEAIRGKKIFQLEHRVLQADSTLGWTFSRAVPIIGKKGDIIEWFGAANDITERKRAEEAVKEAKEQSEQQRRFYETITSGTPDLIYVFDLNYRFTYANSALLSMWGKTWENAVGKGLLDNGYEPWHAEMHEREIDQVKTTKQSIRGEVSFPHATLGRRVYDYIFTPVLNEQGEVEAVAGTTRDITDIRNAETAISESEERFRTMAEGTDILIAVGDEAGRTTYFNQAWATATGRSAGDLIKYGWADLMHPDDRERVLTTFMTAFKKKEPFDWEFRIANHLGGYSWLLAKGTPRFRPDGNFAGYISSSIDITERKLWEQKLETASEELQSINEEMASSNEELAATNEKLNASNEELLQMQQELQRQTVEKQEANDRLSANEQNIRNMVRQAPVGMCIVEGDPLYVVEVNDSFLELIGKSREELKKRPYWEVNAEAAAYYEPITDRVLATGQTFHANEHELMLIRNGKPETVHVDFTYEPMIDFRGKPYAIMIVAIDITDKVLARRKVEQAEESLRMAVDAAGLGTYYINATDRIFHPSPRLKEFFGFLPDEEVPYEAAISQIHPDYRQKATDMVEAAFTKGERFDMEYPVVGYHDGSIRWVRGIGTIQHYDGKDFFTGVLHDITESKQDEMRKNDFIGMVSHELKTPLTSLNAIVQVANAKLKTSEDQFLAGAMVKADIQVKRMTKMINGFLNISRLESGKILIEKSHFNMEDLVREITEEMKLSIGSHQINLGQCVPIDVYADRDKINSVVSNLISNAVKYSPKDTTIWVSCNINEKEVRISVRDEGIGIKSSDADKIFERYFRVESSNTKHISGFGIGLYLSAEIVERHGGRIWLESEPGKGSTFYFSLPLVLH